MNLNFSTFGKEIQDARAKVMDFNGSQDWALFTYGKDFVVKVVGTGDGGLEELKDEFEGSRIHLALSRVSEPLSNLPRFVFISWCGDGVPIQMKGQFNTHVNEACKQFHGYHVHINARSEEDVDPEAIMKKVKASSGAQYSIQSNVANPSLAKPPPPTKKYVPPVSPMHKPAMAPPKAAKNIPSPASQPSIPVVSVSQPQEDDSKPLFSSVGTTYEPVKTNPKPLGSNLFAEMDKKTSQEKLNSSLSSSTGTISKGDPPVHKTSIGNLNKNTQTVKHSFTNLNKPSDTITKSSESLSSSGYQPIKLEPKPLYGTGVAKATYGSGTSPHGSNSSLKEQPKFQKSMENISQPKPDAVSSYTPVRTNPAPLASRATFEQPAETSRIQAKMESVQIQSRFEAEEEARKREAQAQLEKEQRDTAAQEIRRQQAQAQELEQRRQREEMESKLQQDRRMKEETESRLRQQKEQKQREEAEMRARQLEEQKQREEAEIRARQEREYQQQLEQQRMQSQATKKVVVSGNPSAVALYDYDKGEIQ